MITWNRKQAGHFEDGDGRMSLLLYLKIKQLGQILEKRKIKGEVWNLLLQERGKEGLDLTKTK